MRNPATCSVLRARPELAPLSRRVTTSPERTPASVASPLSTLAPGYTGDVASGAAGPPLRLTVKAPPPQTRAGDVGGDEIGGAGRRPGRAGAE